MDLRGFLWAHGEKCVLGLVILVGFGPLTVAADPVPETAELDRTLAEIDDYMKRGGPEPPPPPSWSEDAERRLAPQTAHAGEALPAWLAHRRPGFLYTLPPEKKRPVGVHTAPTDLAAAAAGRFGVEVRWSRASGLKRITVDGLTLQRSVDGKRWNDLATFDVDEVGLHVDRDVSWRHTYRYRIVSKATPKPNTDLPKAKRTQTTEPTPAVRPGRDTEVVVLGGRMSLRTALEHLGAKADTRAYPERGWATIQVLKWLPGREKPVRTVFQRVHEREPIGQPKRVRVDGRRVVVDFSTGATLDEVVNKREDSRAGVKVDVVEVTLRHPDGQTETRRDR